MTRLLAPSPTLSSRTRIEGFTGEWAFLGDVPQGSDRPDDPDVHARAEAWEHWSQDIRIYRQWVLRELEAHPELERIEWLKCQHDIAYFINVYGWIFEARGNRGRGGYTPWVLFERQVDLIRWFEACMAAIDEKADGLVSKCRDVGASWLMVAIFVHQWLFTFPFNGIFLS